MAKKQRNLKDIEKKEDLLERSSNSLIKAAIALQSEIADEISTSIFEFANENGRIQNNASNYTRLGKFDNKIRKIIAKSNYSGNVSEYLKDFDKIDKLNAAIHKDINNIVFDEKLIGRYKAELIESTIDDLLGAGMDVNFTKPLRKMMMESIALGKNIKDAESSLLEYIKGAEGKTGKLERYVGQVSRDSISKYDGGVNDIIKNAYGLDGVLYVGSVIKDSRPQCVRWAAMDEIPLADLDKEIEWAYANGSGMFPGVTKENFCQSRGGHNCRHSALPIRLMKK